MDDPLVGRLRPFLVLRCLASTLGEGGGMITEKVKVPSHLLSHDEGARLNCLELKIKTLESASEAVRAAASLTTLPRSASSNNDENESDRKAAAVARSKQAAVMRNPSLASADAQGPSSTSILDTEDAGDGGADGYEGALQSSLEVG